MIHACDYGEVRYFRMARTFLGRALYWTGVYLVDGLLIDSGPPNLAREVRELCRSLKVRQCVTTHHHEDHSGNHLLLREEFQITPFAHRLAAPRIAWPETHPQLYRRAAWGVPRGAAVAVVEEKIETPKLRFEVIHTPGHAEDHISLFEPERRWLFSGDLYLAPKLKYLRADEDVYAMLDSLRRVVSLEPAAVFCQHKGRVENGAALLAHKLDFLTELGGCIQNLHARGLPEKEIARRLPGSDLVWRVWTSGHFSKRNFVRSFLRQRNSEVGCA